MWLDFTWEYKENSDHWPLFEAGVPSLLMHTGFHGDYHRPQRRHREAQRRRACAQAAAYMLEAVCRVADADELPAFRPASRSENPSMRRQREAPLPPARAAAGPDNGIGTKARANRG